jgi:hypothetical protein
MRECESIRLQFQSSDDLREQRDILRCNPSFYGSARYDSAILNDDSGELTFVRLHRMFKCEIAHGNWQDIAYVSYFRTSSYKPTTAWAGCRVYDQESQTAFVLAKYLLRGALMIPVFNGPERRQNAYYLCDCLDSDMFIRTHSQLALPNV